MVFSSRNYAVVTLEHWSHQSESARQKGGGLPGKNTTPACGHVASEACSKQAIADVRLRLFQTARIERNPMFHGTEAQFKVPRRELYRRVDPTQREEKEHVALRAEAARISPTAARSADTQLSSSTPSTVLQFSPCPPHTLHMNVRERLIRPPVKFSKIVHLLLTFLKGLG